MPSPRAQLVAALVCLALVLGACASAQPVSEVSEAPETAAPASQPASGEPASVPPSDEPQSGAPPTATPTSQPADAPPGKPTGTTFALVSEQPADNGGIQET